MKHKVNIFIFSLVLFSIISLSIENLPWKNLSPQNFLIAIAFFIGLSLQAKDRKTAKEKIKILPLLSLLKFTITPTISFVICKAFSLSLPETIGVMVLSVCPGANISGALTNIAGGNTAFHVMQTFCSALLSPIMTPLMFYVFMHKWIDVPASHMAISAFLYVILPMGTGILLNAKFETRLQKYTEYFPIVCMISVTFLCSIVMNRQAEALLSVNYNLVIVLVAQNIIGLVLGYLAAKKSGFDHRDSVAISYEFGMFDIALAVVICMSFFGEESALAPAVISVIALITGSIFAKFYGKKEHQLGGFAHAEHI